MNKQYKELGKNVIWMIVGNLASKLLVFLLVPFYTSYLNTKEYGIADLITTTVALITPVFSLLISEAILRFALDDDCDDRQVFTISTVIFFVGFIFSLPFVKLLDLSHTLGSYKLFFVIYYFTSNFAVILQQFLKGIEKVDKYVISGIINTILNILANILLLAIFNFGVRGYLLAMIIGNVGTILYSILFANLRQYLMNPKNIDKSLVKKMLFYSIPLIPNSLSWWISNSSDKYVLMFFSGAAITGVYSIAYKIPSLISTLSNIFTSAWQISAVEDFGSKKSIDFFSNIYRKLSSFYILVTTMIILFIKIIARIMFAKEFYFAWSYAIILIFASMFQAMCGFLGTIYTTAYKTKVIFVTTLLGAIINLILNLILIPKFSAYGAAVATLFSYMVVWLIRLIDSHKIIRLNISLKKDLIEYTIITLQCIVMCLNSKYSIYISAILAFIIIIINYKDVLEIINVVKNRFYKFKEKY